MSGCLVEECPRLAYCRGYCNPHYERLRKGTPPERFSAPIGPPRTKGYNTCPHPDRPHYGKGKCAPCYQKVNNKGWRQRNARKLAMGARARKHGLSPNELVELHTRQAGRCANARCTNQYELYYDDHRNGLQIDHDHDTGTVRGLLCKPCNSALGHAKDDLERLRGLVEYLESHTKARV